MPEELDDVQAVPSFRRVMAETPKLKPKRLMPEQLVAFIKAEREQAEQTLRKRGVKVV